MMADIVPGAVFSEHELSDHRGTHGTLSELQRGDPSHVARIICGLLP